MSLQRLGRALVVALVNVPLAAALLTSCSGSSGGSGAASKDAGAAPQPDPGFVPKPTGACPDFAEGTITFSSDGQPRNVAIWVSDKAVTLDGPLVIYWHSTGAQPEEALHALGAEAIAAIKDLGGIVAAPHNDPATGTFPWFLTSGGDNEIDLRVADQVLACAIEKVGVDMRRIHALGFSRGALQTYLMGWRRSGWLASIVLFSGGSAFMPPHQDDSNKFVPASTFENTDGSRSRWSRCSRATPGEPGGAGCSIPRVDQQEPEKTRGYPLRKRRGHEFCEKVLLPLGGSSRPSLARALAVVAA